jgi:hypothetical protein
MSIPPKTPTPPLAKPPPTPAEVPAGQLDGEFKRAAADVYQFLNSDRSKELGEFKRLQSWLGKTLDVKA